MRLQKSLLTPKHWPTWIGVGLMVLYGRLPDGIGRPCGRMLGTLLRWLARSRMQIARRNLALCFPELAVTDRERILRTNFASLGEGAYEFARAWWGSIRSLESTNTIQGLETLHDLKQQGRGVLLLSGHFLTLEICGRLLCRHIALAGMYRRHKSPVFEWAVKRGRQRYAVAMFAREDLRAAVKHVKQDGVLWYAPDQHMRGKDTVLAPFFGIPAATITATYQLVRLTGAAVVPFFHHRDGKGGYVMRIGKPLPDIQDEDIVAHTARVNALIEQMVREAPDEYLWIHRRFKTQADGTRYRY